MTAQQKPTKAEVEAYADKIAELAREVDEWEAVPAGTIEERLDRAQSLFGRATNLYVETSDATMPLSLRAWARGMASTMKDMADAVGEVVDGDDAAPKPN